MEVKLQIKYWSCNQTPDQTEASDCDARLSEDVEFKAILVGMLTLGSRVSFRARIRVRRPHSQFKHTLRALRL